MSRRPAVGIVIAAVIQMACGPDPARSVRIPRASGAGRIDVSAPGVRSVREPVARLEWDAAVCPPAPESAAGPSSVIGRGACPFQQRGAAKCILTDDDLLMEITRPLPDDALFMVYLGVENFRKGGDNANGQIVVGVQTAQGLYRWTTDTAHVTNAPDERFVTIHEAHLPSVPPIDAPEVVVSGTFVCGSVDRQR